MAGGGGGGAASHSTYKHKHTIFVLITKSYYLVPSGNSGMQHECLPPCSFDGTVICRCAMLHFALTSSECAAAPAPAGRLEHRVQSTLATGNAVDAIATTGRLEFISLIARGSYFHFTV